VAQASLGALVSGFAAARKYRFSVAATDMRGRGTLRPRRETRPGKKAQDFFPVNGEGRTRTGDTPVFSRVLYQLSYLAALRRPV
jgi:hypothetical protein